MEYAYLNKLLLTAIYITKKAELFLLYFFFLYNTYSGIKKDLLICIFFYNNSC